MVKDQFSLAARHARHAIEMARAVGADDVESYSLNTLGVAVAELGDVDEGIRLLREAMTMTRASERPHDFHRSYSNLSTVLQDAGRREEAVGSPWRASPGRGSGMAAAGAFLEARRPR